MQSYDLYLPTHLVFVKGRVAELGKLAAGRGKRVLITYGGGSVRRTGLLDEVKAQLKDFEVFEFGGIEPNPRSGRSNARSNSAARKLQRHYAWCGARDHYAALDALHAKRKDGAALCAVRTTCLGH